MGSALPTATFAIIVILSHQLKADYIQKVGKSWIFFNWALKSAGKAKKSEKVGKNSILSNWALKSAGNAKKLEKVGRSRKKLAEVGKSWLIMVE